MNPAALRPGEVLAHIRSLAPSMLPAERNVAQVFSERPAAVVEMSSQQVADAAGASRATVVRACQSLGFTGYQQLRMVLAREAALTADAAPELEGAAGTVRATFAHTAAAIPAMTALLDDTAVTAAVAKIHTAATVLVVGNGLSLPVAQTIATRLMSLGLRASAPADVMSQHIAARMLGPTDVALIVTGSGSSTPSLRAAELARAGGATVIGMTSFARSPVTALAGLILVTGMPDMTFQDEVTVTSRIPQVILAEGLVAAVAAALGDTAHRHRAANLAVIGEYLSED
ncbi:MurR/RpiR family transcriptional regulator [Nocardia concava]|uniref:MurR/RpiR family transcriptional regulator n=1 Tax=Nocardia concava TaxID=257281 RepID=UPI0002D328F7|nr:MurR/RpiR family transcriptional regulator [Nocardia concava]